MSATPSDDDAADAYEPMSLFDFDDTPSGPEDDAEEPQELSEPPPDVALGESAPDETAEVPPSPGAMQAAKPSGAMQAAKPSGAMQAAKPSGPVDEPPIGSLLDGIVGQPAAVERLRAALRSPLPAYLFVGPPGAGLRGAACRFAGELLAAVSPTPERERRLALAEQHPDLHVFDRIGPAMTADQARSAVRTAAAAPISVDLSVMVLCDVDRAAATAPILLKSVEEPPRSTCFVLLAEEVNRSMETLASRCVRIDFTALDEADLRRLLIAEGVDSDRADFAARAAAGSADRASLLATDDAAAARIATWSAMRSSLDGTASTALVAADSALEIVEQAVAPLDVRHGAEREQADKQAEMYGTTAGRSGIDDRQRRELRRLRIDELTMGFVVLSSQIRDEVRSGSLLPGTAAEALEAVADAAEALRFNANQRLALQRLFVRLGRLPTARMRH